MLYYYLKLRYEKCFNKVYVTNNKNEMKTNYDLQIVRIRTKYIDK